MTLTEEDIERIDEIAHKLIREAVEFRGADWLGDEDNARLRLALDAGNVDPEQRWQNVLDVVEDPADNRAAAIYLHRQGKSTCRHCERRIVYEEGTGWIDPEAPATPEGGDDFIWRETCDSNEAFTAEHEPLYGP